MTRKRAAIVALMIGQGESSPKDKDILQAPGYPLLQRTAAAAVRSRHIGRHYASSDDAAFLETAALAGYSGIRRPDELAGDTAQSCDAVRHALKIMENDGPVDIVVVQHASVGTISEQIIDDCIDQLLADDSLSSVVPCHEHDAYHPMRAMGVTGEGLLRPFVDTGKPVSANRPDLPMCYFFDHSIWVLRADAIRTTGGQGPWDCMGNRIRPYPAKGRPDQHGLRGPGATGDRVRRNRIPVPGFPGAQTRHTASLSQDQAEFLEMLRLKLMDRNVPDSVFALLRENATRLNMRLDLARPHDLQVLNTRLGHIAELADRLPDQGAPLPQEFRNMVLEIMRR